MNIVLLTVDCLRADRLDPDSQPGPPAPFLAELGRDGITFENAFATGPATSYSMPGLMTGTYPSWFGGYPPIPEEVKTLAEMLSDNGFKTVGIHSNPWLDATQGFARGFDEYVDLEAPNGNQEGDSQPSSDSPLNRLMDRLTSIYHDIPSERIRRVASTIYFTQHYQFSSKQNSAERLANRAITEIANSDDENLFLWTHFMDLHRPYTVLPENMAVWRAGRITQPGYTTPIPDDCDRIINLYDSNLAYVDEQIQRIYRRTQETSDENLFVVTSDHGEEFGDHGDWFHGQFKLYDELIRVPLLISGSDIQAESFNGLVSLTDIGPTLLEYVDIEPPSNFVGNSLAPALSGEQPPTRKTILSEVYGPHREKVAVRSSDWKYIHHDGSDDKLYNLTDDPQERDNCYSSVEIPSEIRSAFEQYQKNKRDSNKPTAEPELRDRLKNLGYLE